MRYLLSLLGFNDSSVTVEADSVTYTSPKPEIIWVIINGKYLGVSYER